MKETHERVGMHFYSTWVCVNVVRWWILEKGWHSLETRKDLSAMEVMSKVFQCHMRLDLLWDEKACLGSKLI